MKRQNGGGQRLELEMVRLKLACVHITPLLSPFSGRR